MRSFSSLLSLLLLSAASLHTFARNVFVIPATGTGQIQVYDSALGAQTVMTAPTTAFQVLSDPIGKSFIVVSANAAQALSFYDAPLGSPAAVTLPLAQNPSQAQMTPDGERILVVGLNSLYVVNTVSRSLGQTHNIGAGPHFLAINPDSSFAYVLAGGSNILFAINLNSSSSVQVPVSGSAFGLSVGPNGSLYASLTNQVLEIDMASLAARGGISVTGNPGKLAYSPDGRTALAPNLQSVTLPGTSVFVFDLVGRTVTQTLTIGTNAAPIVPETIFNGGTSRYIGLASKNGRIYEIQVPAGTITEPSYQPADSSLAIQVSDEIPARNLYISTSTSVVRVDIPGSNPIGSSTITGGAISFAGAASLGPPSSLIKLNDNQSIGAGAAFRPVGIRALDLENRPVFFTDVNFSTGTTGVTVTRLGTKTGTGGLSYASVVAPANIGTFTVSAIGANALTQTFTLTSGTGGGGNGGGGSQGIVKISGDGQIYLINSGAPPKPLVIQVNDTTGAPLPNQAVAWTTTADPSTLSVVPRTAQTDANGRVTADVVGNVPNLPFGAAFLQPTITATAPGGASTTFIITLLPAMANPPNITFLTEGTARDISGGAGTTVAGAIRYLVVTGGGGLLTAPLPAGVAIPNISLETDTDFTADTGPVGTCKAGTGITDSTGNGTCDLVLGGRTGTNVALAVRVGGLDVNTLPPFRLTVTPGPPVAPSIVQGDGQILNANEVTTRALVAQISDAFGNVLIGEPGTWSVVTPNTVTLAPFTSTVSDGSGRMSTNVRAGTAPGTFQVKLETSGGAVTFNVTVNASLGSMTVVSGQGNPAVVTGQPFPQPLVVQVRNTTGAGVAGVTVTWTATNGTLSAAASTTDTSGQASIGVTAGPNAGPVTVTASVAGLPDAVFNLTARLPGPSLTVSSFTNYATGQPGLVRGSLAVIRGAGMAPSLTGVVNANLLEGRLPLTLAGVTVRFGGAVAPIYQVGNAGGVEWALVQVPFEASGDTTTANITVGGGGATVESIPISTYGPGVLQDYDSTGRPFALAIRSDGQRVTAATPARRGEVIRIYAIGLGQSNPATQTNVVGVPGQAAVVPVTVGLNNAGIPLLYAELAENLIGVWEVAFEVPADVPAGAAIPLGFFIEVTPGVPTYANGSSLAIAP